MADAAAVAQALSAKFFEQGMYASAGQVGGGATDRILPAAAAGMSDAEEFFELSGFAGLSVQAVGYEKGANKPRVHVYLTKSSRNAERSIEKVESEVELKLNRIGRLQVKPETASSSTGRGRLFLRKNRVACGSSCAPSNEHYAGTLGALVKKSGSPKLYALSNNHVFAAGNHVQVGMPILAPSPLDAGPKVQSPREIARHAEIIELRSGWPTLVEPCRCDVAIAEVENPAVVSSWQGEASGYDTPTVVGTPAAGVRVKKYGRTTGLTIGAFESLINTPTPIPFRCRRFTATVYFHDIWAIRADSGTQFALAGDSGSLVVSEDGARAYGLVFADAAQGELGFMISLEHVMAALGDLKLVKGHGV